MAKIHLLEGPVGAGKSTFAAKLSKELAAPSLILDAWFVRLYSPDRPAEGLIRWYAERKERCLSQIWATSLDILGAGQDVVLELGLVEAASRERFYALVESAGYELTIYLLDAPCDVRRERVRQRNKEKGPTYAMDVPDAFFDLASDHWGTYRPDRTREARRSSDFLRPLGREWVCAETSPDRYGLCRKSPLQPQFWRLNSFGHRCHKSLSVWSTSRWPSQACRLRARIRPSS